VRLTVLPQAFGQRTLVSLPPWQIHFFIGSTKGAIDVSRTKFRCEKFLARRAMNTRFEGFAAST